MDMQSMSMRNMHDTFWRENQVIATFHSDTPLISTDGANNAPTILKHLNLEAQLQKLNQFLKDGRINFTLSLFSDKDNPQGPRQPPTSSSSGEQTASNFDLPP